MSAPSNYNQTVIETFRKNGGKVRGGMNLLLLTTTGAKSGQPRIAPLAYSTDGDRYVVAASKGGAPVNPDWFFNILAHPNVTVEVGDEKFEARAIIADDEERNRLYAQHAELMPNFAEYETKTTRRIPIVLLERVA